MRFVIMEIVKQKLHHIDMSALLTFQWRPLSNLNVRKLTRTIQRNVNNAYNGITNINLVHVLHSVFFINKMEPFTL